MAYVPGFKNDLFISYGHVDDQAPKDWVASFYSYLEDKLHSICSKDVTVWRDPMLDPTDLVREGVQREIQQSAIFISILSPGFAEKDWCEREARWFVEAATADPLPVEGKSRIVRVVKTPLGDVPCPEPLAVGTLQCRFYEIDQQSKHIREYSSITGHPTYWKFDEQCSELAQALSGLLKKLHGLAVARQPAARADRAVFVASSTRDVREYRESITLELQHRGCTVLQPKLDVDPGADAIVAAVVAQAAGCAVAVHIVGRFYGTVPEGSAESVVELQLRVTREAASKRPADRPLRIVVWQPEGVADVEPRQQAFLQRLADQKNEAGQSAFDFLTGNVCQFKDALLDVVMPKAPAPVVVTDPTRAVFLLCHRRDLADAELQCIRAWLYDNGFPNDLPVFQGDAAELQRVEEQNIMEADATLIYYGTAEDLWVRQKRQAIQKAWAKTAGPPRPRVRAVYLARPEDDLKQAEYKKAPKGVLRERDLFPALVVLGDCGPFDASKLQPLVSFFRNTPAGGPS